MKEKHFANKKEAGIHYVKLWLKHDELIKVMVENMLYKLLYETMMNHKEGLRQLYNLNYKENHAEYFVFFLVSFIYTTFAIYHKEKERRTIEEVLDLTQKMIPNIIEAWGLNQY